MGENAEVKVVAQLSVDFDVDTDLSVFVSAHGDTPRMPLSDKRAIRIALSVPEHMGCYPTAIARLKWDQNGQICHYCEKPILLRTQVTADHIIPLSRGGSCRAINIVPACHVCNGRKGNRTLREWQTKGFRKDWAHGPDFLEIAKNSPLMVSYQPPKLARSA
jgi:hypothetical protein